MILRLSQTQDQKAIQKLIGALYTEFKTAQNSALFNWPEDQVSSLFQLYKFVLLINKANEPLGFICFQELNGNNEIIVLGMSPQHQRQGYMRQLVEYFVENLCNDGSRVFLEVHENNKRARAFYEKLGFKIDGLRKNYYSDGSTALNMSLLKRSK